MDFFCTGEDKLVFLKKILQSFLTTDSLIGVFLQVTLEYRSIAETLTLHKLQMCPFNDSVPEKLKCGILGAAVPVICYPCAKWRQ